MAQIRSTPSAARRFDRPPAVQCRSRVRRESQPLPHGADRQLLVGRNGSFATLKNSLQTPPPFPAGSVFWSPLSFAFASPASTTSMGRKIAGDGDEPARPREPEAPEAYSNGGCEISDLKKRKKKKKEKKKSKDKRGIATAEAAENNEVGEEEAGNGYKKKKKKQREAEEGVGCDLENGGEEGRKKRKKVEEGVAAQDNGREEEVVEVNGVTMSGKNAKDAKYASLKTFADAPFQWQEIQSVLFCFLRPDCSIWEMMMTELLDSDVQTELC